MPGYLNTNTDMPGGSSCDGTSTTVSGAIPLLSLNLACLFECGLGLGEG